MSVQTAGAAHRMVHLTSIWHCFIICSAVFISYANVMHAPFLMSWDDADYVVNNTHIRQLSTDNLQNWFSSFYVGNYAPLTMLSFAINYALGGVDPFHYHITNIALHCINSILLYQLTKKLQGNALVAFYTALLFSVHPALTGAVAWISERKTVLCACFSTLSLLAYYHYSTERHLKWLVATLLLMISAVLSKGAAMTLPVCFIAIDVWLGHHPANTKLWLKKLPFFAISLCIGLVAIRSEKADNFLWAHPEYTGWRSLFIASEIYVRSIWHIIVPVGLKVYYPFPENVGIQHTAYTIITILAFSCFIYAIRYKKSIVAGSILFYSANIFLVLQFVQFSTFMMADHYSYFATPAILFPILYYVIRNTRKQLHRLIVYVLLPAAAIALATITYATNDMWKSDYRMSLHLMKENPESAEGAYNAAIISINTGDTTAAKQHFKQATNLAPNHYKAWYHLGVIAAKQNEQDSALMHFNTCLMQYSYTPAYFARSMIYINTHRFAKALTDISIVTAREPDNARAWYISGYCNEHIHNMSAAISDYSYAIANDSNVHLYYKRRGICRATTNKLSEAMSDLNKAISFDSSDGEAWYYRAAVKYSLGLFPCKDLDTAERYGYHINETPEERKVRIAALKKICP